MPSLDEYQSKALRTKRLPPDDPLDFLLLGLFGECGSVAAEVKKHRRDQPGGYRPRIDEELGDALWYLAVLADHLQITLGALVDDSHSFASAADGSETSNVLAACHRLSGLVGTVSTGVRDWSMTQKRRYLSDILQALLQVGKAAGVDLDTAAKENLKKGLERWPIEPVHYPRFDDDDDPDEQLPRHFVVDIIEKQNPGKKPYVLMRSGGIHIGDRLTDNIKDPDDYRFHDVFHMAYAAVLGWSPVLRKLLRRKRKSNGQKDEQQDGARPELIEEGISAWIFAHAKDGRDFYADFDSLDYSVLKLVRTLVDGYEVDKCPYWQWEEAILQGFEAFRFLREHRRGRVTMDLMNRKLSIEPIPE